MPRTPDGLYPRGERVTFRLDEAEIELLDRVRGTSSRSTYLRSLLAADVKRWTRSNQKGNQ